MRPPPHPSVRAMAMVLRIGTIVSTALLAAGLAITLVSPDAAVGHALLTAGLVILMMTPVANLMVALADEIVAREWRFAALGVLVLLLLAGSVLVAFA